MDYHKALTTLKGAHQTPSHNASEYFQIGMAYLELDCWQNAIEAFEQALLLQPDYAAAHFGLGLVYLASKDLLAAWNEYDVLKHLDKSTASWLLDLIRLRALNTDNPQATA